MFSHLVVSAGPSPDFIFQSLRYLFVIMRYMRNKARRTIFHPGGEDNKASATMLDKIEGTITKKAVECFRVGNFMAGKIGALSISKKAVTVFHRFSLSITRG